MIPDAEDKVVRAVGRVETIEVARLVETESSIIELIFAKKGHVPGHEVPVWVSFRRAKKIPGPTAKYGWKRLAV